MLSSEEPLPAHIQRLSSLHFRAPLFSATLEQRFTEQANRFRSRRQWLEGLLSICLYCAFAVASQELWPDRFKAEALLRFGIVMPVVLLVNASMWLRMPIWLHESAILIGACVAGSVEFYLHLHTDGGASFPHLAVVAVLVFTNTVMRLRLPYAVLAFCWAVGAECMLLGPTHGVAFQFHSLYASMVIAISVLTLVANYSQDREARLAFLRHAREKDLVGSLAQTNEHLATAAMTDALTGLPNRAALDHHLAKVWSQPALASAVCSFIMIDIDRFKSLNDRYGHLYGDRVIKRVAHLLSEALRGENDCVARYGGEEFVVVLPNTPLDLALRVAERLRGVIELAGLPSLRTGDLSLNGMRATISCGVSAGLPQLCADPFTIIGNADEALYQAKRDGRNMVRIWKEPMDSAATPALAHIIDANGILTTGAFTVETIPAPSTRAYGESSRVA